MTYEKICEICGKPFTAGKHNAKYCCKECKHIANKATERRNWHKHKDRYNATRKENERERKRKKRDQENDDVSAPSKEKRKSRIVELQQEAIRCGISYGKLQAMKYLEEERIKKDEH